MDIRKFFGGAPDTKTSEKSSNLTSKNAGSKHSKTHEITKTAKKSPKSPSKAPIKEKTEVETKKTSKRTVSKLEDSDGEDFTGKDAKRAKQEADVKTKENLMTGNKDASKTSAKEAAGTKCKEKHNVILPKDEDRHNNNTSKSKSKPDPAKKRKIEPELVPESEEDEAPVAKRRPASKATHKAVIYDSESDEDPLPKSLRDKSPVRKASRKRNIDLDSDNTSAPIREAMSKIQPKVAKNSEQTVVTSSVLKRPVNANDFFGVSPIHRTEKHQPGKGCGSKDVLDSLQSIQADKDVSEPAKKIKLDESSAEDEHHPPGPSVRLSEKLAVKRKVAEESDAKESLRPLEDKQSKLQAKTKPDAVSKSPQKASPEKLKPKPIAAKTPTSAKKGSPAESEKGSIQKRGSAFLAYKNRDPPKALGSKEIPEGAENCLEGLTFVITGVLESIERDDAKALVERCGGKLMQNVSKNTKYLVIGRDPGEAKTSKAKQLGVKQLDEDGLLDLIRSLPAKKSKYEIAAAAREAAVHKTPRSSSSTKPSTPSTAALHASVGLMGRTPETQKSEAVAQSSQKTLSPEVSGDGSEALMWVDRYKPTSSKQIIGQQGDKSNAKKLLNWLTSWHKNVGKKPVFGRTSDVGAGYKAALLSGPPGVGKTTTAQIICQEAGFSYVELNASDTRSKRCLKEEVAEALSNHTLVDFFVQSSFQTGASGVDGQKHCLIMDEVDGMAGNEDRGGMQELIQLIKQTKIPIICMCNDRNHPKVRSLSNYCFDLRFQRPRIEQIKGAMMSIAFREGLKIPAPALNDIILAANQDIRQVLHNLSMWTVKDKTLTYEQLKQEANKAQKDLHLGPFDVCRKVFAGGEETNKMTINDKSDLFFHDYSIGPLFVQENYIHVTPFSAQGSVHKHLRCLSRAADSIAAGDLVDAHVRQRGNWNLLPTQAIFASVIPGESMRGSIGQMIQFPSWLGKNSTTSKNDRLHQELRTHMRLNILADKRALGQDYLPALLLMLTSPLINEGTEGVSKVVSLLDTYDLLREDFDSVIELTSWPGMKDPMSQIDSKVKAAFTRAYNKEVHLTPYATGAATKKGRGRGGKAAGQEDYELELGDEVAADESEHSDDDVGADTMIKAKKAVTKPTKSSSSQDQNLSASQSKGKGKGKATKKSS